MFMSNKRASFYLWPKENLEKHQKVSKYYENDCRYQIFLTMTWFINIFFPMSDSCKNVPTSVYPLGFFFLVFPSFIPVFRWYCVRRYNLRFLFYPGSIYTLEVFLGCLYWTLAIFPCICFTILYVSVKIH